MKPQNLNFEKNTAVYMVHYNPFLLNFWYEILLSFSSLGVSVVAQGERIRLETMRLQVRFLTSHSGLRIWRCHELWCKSQTRLGSGVAVAVV